MRFLAALLALCLTAAAAPVAEKVDVAPLKKWLSKQDDFHAVSADFTQTRALRSLKSPVAAQGKLWWQAPGALRWEIGDPPKNIVIRDGPVFWVITPGKKRAERHAAESVGGRAGPMGMMLQFPIAKDYEDFRRKFDVLAVELTGTRCHTELAPRDPQARKFLSAFRLDFDTVTGHVLAFEMVTKDGSSMRQEFTNVRLNPKIERRVFDFDLAGYDIVEAKD